METVGYSGFPRILEQALLRSWKSQNKFCVYDVTRDYLIDLTEEEYQFLSLCDGTRTLSELESLMGYAGPSEEHIGAFLKWGILEIATEKKPIDEINKAHDSSVFIRNVCWLITGSCNLKCKHCYMRAPEGYWGRPLSWEKMNKILDQFQECNVLSVVLTGGEPTTRPDFIQLVNEIKRRKIKIRGMNTNGTRLLQDNKLDAFNCLPYSPDIAISLDGLEFHKQFRGISDTKVIFDAIKAARKAGLHVSINTSITKTNAIEVPKIYDLILSLGIDGWKINFPNRIGRWRDYNNDKNQKTDAISIVDEFQAYKQIFDRWVLEGKPFHLSLGNVFRFGKCGVYNEENEIVDYYDGDTFACEYYRDEVVVMPDGGLLGCNGLMEIPGYDYTGNILIEGLAKTWQSDSMRKFKDLKISDILNAPGNEACRTCPLLADCGAGCRVTAYAETGNFLSRDPHMCEMMLKHYHYFQEHDKRPQQSRILPPQDILLKQANLIFQD